MEIKKFKQFENNLFDPDNNEISDYFLEYLESGQCDQLGNQYCLIFGIEDLSIYEHIVDRLNVNDVEFISNKHIYNNLSYNGYFLFISEELESYINNFTFYGGGGYNNRYINIPKNLYISMNDYFKISLPEVYAILHLYLEKKFNLEGSWFSLRYQD